MISRIAWSIIPPVILIVIILLLWHRLQTVTLEKDAAQQQVNTLSSDLKTQNAAISQWQAKANALAEKLRQEEQRVLRLQVANQTQINQLNSQPVPKNCQSAVNWGTKEAKKLTSQWH